MAGKKVVSHRYREFDALNTNVRKTSVIRKIYCDILCFVVKETVF